MSDDTNEIPNEGRHNMTAFYEVVLNGSYKGKDNKNSLYYRTAYDPAGGALGFGGASELAEEVIQEIVPAFLDLKPAEYLLESIDVYPRNNLFELLYQLPYKKPVNLPGTSWSSAGGTDGPALAVNVRFNLEPTLVGLQTLTAPKRGYVAVGPCNSSWIDDAGKLSDTLFNNAEEAFGRLAAKLSENLESIDPPCLWFPIRVSKHYGALNAFLGWGWADISSASVDPYVSFRRSRRITG